jgi:Protein of unknown function (DUF3644)
MKRKIHSEKRDLILKAREAMLSAVQIYNNPLTSFKTEAFIVLSIIAWTYLLHAYYRSAKVEYRYFIQKGKRKIFARNPDGSVRYWGLHECTSKDVCRTGGPCLSRSCPSQLSHRRLERIAFFLFTVNHSVRRRESGDQTPKRSRKRKT